MISSRELVNLFTSEAWLSLAPKNCLNLTSLHETRFSETVFGTALYTLLLCSKQVLRLVLIYAVLLHVTPPVCITYFLKAFGCHRQRVSSD